MWLVCPPGAGTRGEGMPGKVFPTLNHPPRYVLMGEKHVFDGGTYDFPRL